MAFKKCTASGRWRRWPGYSAALILSLALCACSPSDEKAGSSSPEPGASHGQRTDGRLSYPASDFHEQAPGKPGGTLRATVEQDTQSLDVHAISFGNVQWLGRILFDCLVYQDEQGRPSPWLAKSWEISPDGKKYTFHLRDDVTFSDGEKFNAEAVRVNLEHMRDPATRSPLAAAYIAPLDQARVVDEFTLEATLKEPYSPFLDVLAQSWLSMISPKQIRENPKSIAQYPIGSGPFVLESYVRNQGLKFTRRQDYHWAPPVTRHQGPAYLERLELTFVPEPLIRFSSLQSGQYDFTLDAPPQNAVGIRSNPDLVLNARVRKGNPYRSLTFNTRRPPFDDPKVRRALAKAIDREGLAAITGFGEFIPKSDFLAANTRFYDPAFQDALRYDPVEANRLLDEAGWTERDAQGIRSKDGKALRAHLLTVDTPSMPKNSVVAVQSDLRKLGVEVNIEVLPLAEALQRYYSGNADYDLAGGGYWHTNTPDGLYILYHSDSITTAKRIGQNLSRLRDAELDDLLSRARRSTDDKQLQQLYSQAQRRLTELVPSVPAYESEHISAHQSYVKGLIFDTSHNTPFFTSVWLDKGAQ